MRWHLLIECKRMKREGNLETEGKRGYTLQALEPGSTYLQESIITGDITITSSDVFAMNA